MSNELNVVSADHIGGDLYTSSQTGERALNGGHPDAESTRHDRRTQET
jgi:hypothetical protein